MQKTGSIIKNLRKKNKMNQRELGEVLGVSQTSVAHYEAGTREPNIETLKLLSQTFNESIDTIIGNSTLIIPDVPNELNLSAIKSEIISSLLNKDDRTFIQLFKERVVNNYSIEFIVEDIIREIQYEIGDLWYKGEITEADEHYITNMFRKVIGFLSIDSSNGIANKTAVTMSIDSEHHTLGIEMINVYLESLGVKPIYLGNSVQFKSLEKLLEEQKPNYIFLSITIGDRMNHLIALVDFIIDKFGEKFQIVIGGQGVNQVSTFIKYRNVTFISSLSQVKELITESK